MVRATMDLAGLLHTYGYALLFLGVFAEGESLLVLAGYFAQREYFTLWAVIATAYVAAVAGDQFFFHMGRRHARKWLTRFPRLREKVNVALARVERNQVKVVLSMRFLWGLRIALPIALGLTKMSARRYFLFDLISAAVWSVTFATLGFVAGRFVTRLVDEMHRYEIWIVVALVGAGAVLMGVRWIGAHWPRRSGGS